MGKVKNWAWDMAETYLDELITKIKDGTLTVATALAEAKTKKDIAWDLVGIHSESEPVSYTHLTLPTILLV